MPTPTLFPLDDPLSADPSRPDPVLWIEHVAILSERDPTAVIREVSFRRGLNIIQTTPNNPDDDRVAGHSVGKTLLVRLIRYSLGEQHYGSDDTELRVRRKFPNAHVVATWHVGGAEWTVVRPLGSHSPGDSRAVEGRDWIDAFDSKDTSFRRFLEAVETQTLGDLPSLTLERGRSPKWLDLLGWLARDYQCGYRRSNEWRHPDANSGVALDRDENALLMQWVAGLLSDDENRLREAHQQLLRQRGEAKRKHDEETRRADALLPTLREKLGATDNPEQPSGDLSIDQTLEQLTSEKIDSLRRLRQDQRSASDFDSLRHARQEAETMLIDCKADLKSAENAVSKTEAQLSQIDNADAPRPYAARPSYENCEAKPACWMKQQEALQSGEDPSKEHYRQSLEEDLREQKRLARECRDKVGESQREYETAASNLTAERERLASVLQAIDRDIGRWDGYAADVETYRSCVALAASESDREKSLGKQVDESLKRQETLRQSQQSVLRKFSAYYRQVLQLVFGNSAAGHIRVDGNGLRPEPSDRLAPDGAALSVMTAVLAFDLSAIASSMAGFGRHPRFLIHDSPREADMEGQLFGKVFDIAHSLELLNENSAPNFQYIVTTTTLPPSAYASLDGPYVRLTLDALSEDNRLLGVAF